MFNAIRTLRPGLLLSLKTSIKGGVMYDRQEIEAEHLTEQGEKRARWETTKTIEDPVEHELAVKVRGKCRSVITALCVQSEFGLLCPVTKEGELDGAVDAARKLAGEFNAQAKTCRVEVYCLSGRIAPDDVEAARAIASEVRALLKSMENGIKSGSVEEIREAARKAKGVGQMLSGDVQAKVNDAVKQARIAASEIARRVVKDAEPLERVVTELRTEAIMSARFDFLDLDAPDVKADLADKLQVGKALDLETGNPAPAGGASEPRQELELDAAAAPVTTPAAPTRDLEV